MITDEQKKAIVVFAEYTRRHPRGDSLKAVELTKALDAALLTISEVEQLRGERDDALEEVERLRAENKTLDAAFIRAFDDSGKIMAGFRAELDDADAEVERLRAELAKAAKLTASLDRQLKEQAAEVERQMRWRMRKRKHDAT
jgi:chromosome segregation ATPase